MISRMSKLAWLSPRYAVSTGNQVDLTDQRLPALPRRRTRRCTTFAVYVEGFKDGDGLEFARAVREVVRAGRDVDLLQGRPHRRGQDGDQRPHRLAGRGLRRLRGDRRQRGGLRRAQLRRVPRPAQGVLADGRTSRWRGPRLAALSNAGYEAVGIADSLRGEGWHLELARLESATTARLQSALAKAKLDALVDVRNPLDLTPMANDEAHEDAVRAFCGDAGVDLVLCSTIPLTPAMATLASGVPENESIRFEGSLVNRLARVLAETDKPIVVSIDCGEHLRPDGPGLRGEGAADLPIRGRRDPDDGGLPRGQARNRR